MENTLASLKRCQEEYDNQQEPETIILNPYPGPMEDPLDGNDLFLR